MVWKQEERWENRRLHLGRQQEAFDAELYAILEVVKIAEGKCKNENMRRVAIYTDSKTPLKPIQSDQPGPVQALGFQTMTWESGIHKKAIPVEYRWVPAHTGIEGNGETDREVPMVAYNHRRSYTEMQNPVKSYDYVTLAHISRRLMEAQWEESNKDITEIGEKSSHGYRYELVNRGGNSEVRKAWKAIVARFYQMKAGHALMALYLRWIGK